MQITPQQLQIEAGQMALEIRFKDQAIAMLEAELARLKELVEELQGADNAEAGAKPVTG